MICLCCKSMLMTSYLDQPIKIFVMSLEKSRQENLPNWFANQPIKKIFVMSLQIYQTGFLPSVGTFPFDSASSIRGSRPSLACTKIPSGKVPPVGWRCHGEFDHQLWLCSRAASRHLAHTTEEACYARLRKESPWEGFNISRPHS